eukprot:358611-Chlamydomonas_euryale.AAC.2
MQGSRGPYSVLLPRLALLTVVLLVWLLLLAAGFRSMLTTTPSKRFVFAQAQSPDCRWGHHHWSCDLLLYLLLDFVCSVAAALLQRSVERHSVICGRRKLQLRIVPWCQGI